MTRRPANPQGSPPTAPTTPAVPAPPAVHPGAPHGAPLMSIHAPHSPAGPMDVNDIVAARELFWHNVMREILTSLSVASMSRGPSNPDAPPTEQDALFDGRMAVLTKGGERVAIAGVFPLFACGINTDDSQKSLSVAVECTVFQIRTPDGHVFTLPLHEIRGFHAMTPELMRQLAELSREQDEESDDERIKRPFGFAAFAPQAPPADPYYPAPGGG